MSVCEGPLQVTVIGGGMITHDQILPSLYHLQRLGQIGEITVCGRRSAPLKELAEARAIAEAFPGQSFRAVPNLDEDPKNVKGDLYEEVIAAMPPRNLVVVAVPDQYHHAIIMHALQCDQHVIAVKPLVLKVEHALEIEELAKSRGLFVGVEYHKRFDRRSLEARTIYRKGRLGDFRCGEAKLIEPWYYRHSNFQNWFTKENTDPFCYIGCHYVDLVYFITGLRPVEVSVRGVEGKFPNGNVGFLWSHGLVTFENGGILSVINGLGYPDGGAGSNDQGITLFCEGDDCGGLLAHNDQFRGVQHSYVDTNGQPNAHPFRYINPDYLRLVPWEGEGLKPVGYGYDSIEANVHSVIRICRETEGMKEQQAVQKRCSILEEIDSHGIIATPQNSVINELVMEAARLSILDKGRTVRIQYGSPPSVD